MSTTPTPSPATPGTLHRTWRISTYQTESGRWSAQMIDAAGNTHYLGVRRPTAAEAAAEAVVMCDLMDGHRVGLERAAELLDARRVDAATDRQVGKLVADISE